MRIPTSRVVPAAGLAALATVSWQAGSVGAGLFGPTPAAFDEIDDLLNVVEFVDLDDGQGGTNRTLRFSGVNLQLVNGDGSTETADGTGNLIVGYNELTPSTQHTGSHNVVVGTEQHYTSWGGLVAGRANSIIGPFASVSGGRGNVASGAYAAVGGGRQNLATADYAAAFGGQRNTAGADYATVVGGGSAQAGLGNTASAEYATAVGGRQNGADGVASVVVGGLENTAPGEGAVVAGGQQNQADGLAAAILGGQGRATDTDYQVIGDGGGGDADWTLTTVDGTSALVAQAPLVGIGTSDPETALTIVPPDDESTALDVAGDVRIGRGDDEKTDASEHVRIRATEGDWYVGATNDKDRPSFFVGREDSPDGIFTVTPDGDVGFGTSSPEAALHVARTDGDARVILEGGDLMDGAEVGVRLVQAGGVEAQIGFFERLLRFRYADDAVGLALDPFAATVLVGGGLDVTGTANVSGSATIDGGVSVGGPLHVEGDLRVVGDLLRVGGLIEATGGLRSETFDLAAWGVVEMEGDRVSGSPNWTSSWDSDAADYRIELTSGSSQGMAVFVVWMGGGGGRRSVRTAGTDPDVGTDEIRVMFHNAPFPKSHFAFFAISE